MSISFDAADVKPIESSAFPVAKNEFATVRCNTSITAGLVCALNNANHRADKAQKIDLNTSGRLGMALSSGEEGEHIVMQTKGLITFGTGVLTQGTNYVLLDDGAIGTLDEITDGDAITDVGIAVTDDYLRLSLDPLGERYTSSSSSSSSSG